MNKDTKQNLDIKAETSSFKMHLSAISGAFMLPIATIAITSFFLAIGALFESFKLNRLGYVIKSIGFPIMHAIPLLFCVAFATTFTKNNGIAVWCAIISYLTFIHFQSAFITQETNNNWKIMFDGKWREGKFLISKFFGVPALNTSIFGSLIIGGLLIPYLFKNFSNVEFPQYISYFSGKRFLPLASALAAFPLAFLFLIIWPYVGAFISFIGTNIAKTPYGIDSFFFGLFERLLIPTGLHHIFASSLWYTPLGGDLTQHISDISSQITANSSATWQIPKTSVDSLKQIYMNGFGSFASWQGDSFLGISAISLPDNQINNQPVFQYLQDKNLRVGRFTQGKFPIMQFGLPTAGLAMIYAAPVEKRNIAKAQIIPAILTSFIIGITEPIEFTFMFIAPQLFYGFHAVMCGLSFMFMNILGAHIPTAFSGGFIELVMFGIIPVAKGTAFWWWAVVGAAFAPIYFGVFYLYIKRFNISTPGRSESDFEIISSNKSESTDGIPENIKLMVEGFGGLDNIPKPFNCASRLRYDIIDKSKVDESKLKASGIIAIKWVSDSHLQAIVGPKAESINNHILKMKEISQKIEKTEN